jgi:hypothetical protein
MSAVKLHLMFTSGKSSLQKNRCAFSKKAFLEKHSFFKDELENLACKKFFKPLARSFLEKISVLKYQTRKKEPLSEIKR